MTIGSRIRKVREIIGWKQAAVAEALNISQQAYSCIEKNADGARLDTLRRFCEVMDVKLSFLMDEDIPITEEIFNEYGKKGFLEIVANYRKMERKVEVFNDLLQIRRLAQNVGHIPVV